MNKKNISQNRSAYAREAVGIDEIKELREQRNLLAGLVAFLLIVCLILVVKGDFLQIRYVGSTISDKYHRESCEYVDRIYGPNRIYYYSIAAAEADGRTPCALCEPGRYE